MSTYGEDAGVTTLHNEIDQVDRRLQEITFEIGWHQITVDLYQLPSWQRLIDFLRTQAESSIQQLTRVKLEAYEQGFLQGKLAALRLVTQPKPLQHQALDALEQEAQNLRSQRLELEQQLRTDFRIR